MSERVAIVGSRKGADLAHVVRLVEALRASQPDTIVVSGGAAGVDQMAESTWFRLGGRVRSYRPAPLGDGFGVEIWNYGGSEPALVLPPQEHRVQLASYTDACFYRDWLIAESVDRLVVFGGRGDFETHMAASLAKDRDVPIYEYMASAERS